MLLPVVGSMPAIAAAPPDGRIVPVEHGNVFFSHRRRRIDFTCGRSLRRTVIDRHAGGRAGVLGDAPTLGDASTCEGCRCTNARYRGLCRTEFIVEVWSCSPI